MRRGHNYRILLEELENELSYGLLRADDLIQVQRLPSPLRNLDGTVSDYFPIVNWYYNEKTMQEVVFAHSSLGSKQDILSSTADQLRRYDAVKASLETITMQDCLDEMRHWHI